MFCVVARGNNSLGREQRWGVFAALAAISLLLASVFAWVGAWPVLLYSAAEMVLLGLAFYVVERRAQDWERLTVDGDRVIVERQRAGRHERHEYNRFWVRIDYGEDRFGSPARLTLRSSGAALNFGEALPASQRRALARELRRLGINGT
jgi:uncharacterized membrane protein